MSALDAFRVQLALAERADVHGQNAYPSTRALAEELDIDKRTVANALVTLVEQARIEKTAEAVPRQRGATYRLIDANDSLDNSLVSSPPEPETEPEPENHWVHTSCTPDEQRAHLNETPVESGTIVMALEEDDGRVVEIFNRRAREGEAYRNRIERQYLSGTAPNDRQKVSAAGLLAFGYVAELDHRRRTEADVRQLVDDLTTATFETCLLAVFDALGLDVSGHDGHEARRNDYMPTKRRLDWSIENARRCARHPSTPSGRPANDSARSTRRHRSPF